MVEAASFFIDGQAYERLMGRCSRAVGEVFLDWLSLSKGLKWLDVGCGTGAFTELIIERVAPLHVSAIDPAEAQIAYPLPPASMTSAGFRAATTGVLCSDCPTFKGCPRRTN